MTWRDAHPAERLCGSDRDPTRPQHHRLPKAPTVRAKTPPRQRRGSSTQPNSPSGTADGGCGSRNSRSWRISDAGSANAAADCRRYRTAAGRSYRAPISDTSVVSFGRDVRRKVVIAVTLVIVAGRKRGVVGGRIGRSSCRSPARYDVDGRREGPPFDRCDLDARPRERSSGRVPWTARARGHEMGRWCDDPV